MELEEEKEKNFIHNNNNNNNNISQQKNMEDVEFLLEQEKINNEKISKILLNAGIPKEYISQYIYIFQKHEIDESILNSTLLTDNLLKEIGIEKVGHRLKILKIGALKKAMLEQEEIDYNQQPNEPLSFEKALLNANNENDSEESINQKKKKISDNNKNLESYENDKKEMNNNTTTENIYNISETNEILNRAKYIPIRLNEKERKQLHLLEAALSVSVYTDKVDIISSEKRSKRSFEQLKDICAILSGLLVASDYSLGQKLIVDRKFKDNAKFFQDIFEIGRRYKIMNPEKMRTDYGKLIYLLQDSELPEIQNLMEFSCNKPVLTVYNFLLQKDALHVLQDPLIPIATQAIIDDKTKSRYEIQKNIKKKEKAVEELAHKYQNEKISRSDIKLALRSIGDNNSFLIGTRDPVDKMIKFLTKYFNPDKIEENYSLDISFGVEGARLSHDHMRQYHFVLQSLTLWREVIHDMFKLWILAEQDLLDPTNRYRLTNTGQGLNRVQPAPRIGSAMSRILSKVQKKVGFWVGSSVIHLGDHNVPNALMFIDKYTQITRIINPVILTIEQIDEMVKNQGLKDYIDRTFGGKEHLKKEILVDFFRHAFDGSGADNFFDAGSCIDGRLTSAWNWCELLPKKKFYPIFKLSGFIGFDGDFQK